MKKLFNIFFLFAIAAAVTSCEEEEAVENWAEGIAGLYTSTATNTSITVNRIDDKTVSIDLTTGSGSGSYAVAFSSVTMTSETAFTLNEVSQDGAVCIGTETFTGTGTASNGNISLFLTVVGTSTSLGYPCEGTDTRSVSASM